MLISSNTKKSRIKRKNLEKINNFSNSRLEKWEKIQKKLTVILNKFMKNWDLVRKTIRIFKNISLTGQQRHGRIR